jgi:hypothetical protein
LHWRSSGRAGRAEGGLCSSAWRWQKLLDDGVYTSVTEIAEAERIGKSIRAAAHGCAARGRERDIAASLSNGLQH